MVKIKSMWALVRALWLTGAGSMRVAWLARAAENGDTSATSAIRTLIMAWCRRLLTLFSMRVETIWRGDLPSANGRYYVIMSNHVSHLDIPLILLTFDRYQLTMIAKKELFSIPLFGKAMRYSRCCLELDRQNGGRAMETLQNAIALMEYGGMVWIAPEGSRSRNGQLGRFKRGGFWLAQQSGAVIVPVTIVGSGKVLPADHWLPQLGRTVKVIVGPWVDTQDGDLQDTEQLMQKVKAILTDNLTRYGGSEYAG